MRHSPCLYLSIILIWPLYAPSLQADEPVPAPLEAHRFLEEAQQRREAIEQAERARQLQRGTPQAPHSGSRPIPPEEHPDAPCWYLTGVQLQGNRMINDQRLRTAMQPVLKPCMSPGQINRLLATITKVYADAGYVASRPVVLNLPRDHHPLSLAIEEGFVEAIELVDQDLPISLASAFPGMIGKPLYLRDLESGLDQLNRLRSVDLTADIAPGALLGGSRILLRTLARLPRWQVSTTWDNGGSLGTGRHRTTLGASVDSPLERNDALSLYGTLSHKAGPAGSETLGLYYSLPYGRWTLALAANHFQFRSTDKGLFGLLHTRGTTRQVSYSLERTLWRDQHRLFSASLRLDDKRQETRFQNLRLAYQSPHYQALEAGFHGLWAGQATWTTFIGYSQGLGGWRSDSHLTYTSPNARSARYGKWRASVSRTAGYSMGGLHWVVNSSWQGQYSPNALPTLEGFVLGDASQIRGFAHQGVETGSGLAWRNALYLPIALGAGLSLTPTLGLDAGWADGRGRDARVFNPAPVRGDQLIGATLGLSLDHPHATLAADYQRGLYRRNGPLAPGYWRLALQLKL